MQDNFDKFPEADLINILRKIKKGSQGYNSLQEYVIDLVRRLDKNGDEVISFSEFSSGLKGLNIFLSAHEEQVLMRRFDRNRDGVISMEEFYNTLAEVFWFEITINKQIS